MVKIRRKKLYPAFLFPFSICLEQKYEKYQNFSSENLHVLVGKFSVYFNRRVSVMEKTYHQTSAQSGQFLLSA